MQSEEKSLSAYAMISGIENSKESTHTKIENNTQVPHSCMIQNQYKTLTVFLYISNE